MTLDPTLVDIQRSVRDDADGVYSPAVLRLQGQGRTRGAGRFVTECSLVVQRLDAAFGRGPG
jgi:hypothetical protein